MSFVFGINAFGLTAPILAGYIAYSTADRPGLKSGLVGGAPANLLGAGFLGGIIAGFWQTIWRSGLPKKLHLPTNLEVLKPILIIPLIITLIVGAVMIFVIGTPVANLLTQLNDFLKKHRHHQRHLDGCHPLLYYRRSGDRWHGCLFGNELVAPHGGSLSC